MGLRFRAFSFDGSKLIKHSILWHIFSDILHSYLIFSKFAVPIISSYYVSHKGSIDLAITLFRVDDSICA